MAKTPRKLIDEHLLPDPAAEQSGKHRKSPRDTLASRTPMPQTFLLATLLALAAGPLLYAAARRSAAALAFLDGFVLVSIAGLVVLEVVPGTFTQGGPWSFAFLLGGLFGPTLLERAFRRAERLTHIGALALAVAGLVFHALADGVALAPSGNWALPAAVV